MFGTYLTVLRTPGALRFSAAGFVGRIQMSMISLGAVLFLQFERGSYAVAGMVSAIYALSTALASPQISRLIDVFGQRIILLLQLAVHVPAMAVLIGLAQGGAGNGVLYLLAVITGAAQPNLGPLVRARWSAKLTGTGSLRTAFAWESLLDEVIFVGGPPLATLLALSLFHSAALVIATVMLAIGAVWLALQGATAPVPANRAAVHGRRPAILLPGVAAISLVYVLMGGTFGSWEVSTVAYAAQHGHPGAAGVILALNAVGSLSGGLIFGALRLRATLLRQFLFVLILLAIGWAPIPFLHHLWLLAIGSFVSGVAVAPVLISGMSLIERIVPMSRLTESMAWPSAGIALGLAVASPIAGVVVDAHSASWAYLISSGCAVVAVVVAFAQVGPLRRANRAAAERVAAGRQVPAEAPTDSPTLREV